MADPELLARLDRLTYLLVALLALQLIHVFGGALVQFGLVAVVAVVAACVAVLVLGLAGLL